MGVAKVDRDVAYVAMVVHVCCKRLFPNVSSIFTYVASVFIWMCHIFHTYVTSVYMVTYSLRPVIQCILAFKICPQI
jgi:hypothetical protein